jgi:drug/metabolite transporter (DMT)-like permease
MLLSTVCFTVNVLLIRALGRIQAVDIWLISCARFAVGLVVLATVYRHQVRFGRVFTKFKLAGRGIVGGLGVAVYYLTVVHLGAGRATFINNTYIVLGALLAVWILRERFRLALGIGGVAALLGLALLTDMLGGGPRPGPYDLLAIASALASAYVVVTIRLLHAEGEHSATIFAAQCVYGFVLCAVPALLHYAPVAVGPWGLMLLSGGVAAVGQLAMTRAFRDLPVAEGSLLQILVPLGIAAGGVLFFQESFTTAEMVGAALILGGAAFATPRRGG